MFDIPSYTPKTIKDFFPEHCVFHLILMKSYEKASLFPEELALISESQSEKRRQEFSAGRYASHCCLRTLGVAATPILRGSLGEPLFPDALCGSISHSKHLTLALLAKKEHYTLIGTDVEQVKEVSPGLLSQIASEVEQESLGKSLGPHDILTLFSAKESLYKMLAPIVQKRFWYHDAACIAWNRGSLLLELTTDLSDSYQKGWRTEISAALVENSIVTYGAS